MAILYFAILYSIFAATIAAWAGLAPLLGWKSDLRFLTWNTSPYDNVFIRAAVWLLAVSLMSFVISTAQNWFDTRIRSVPTRFIAKVVVGSVILIAVHLLWIGLIGLLHAQTEITLDWWPETFMINVFVRSIAIAVGATALDCFNAADSARAANWHTPPAQPIP